MHGRAHGLLYLETHIRGQDQTGGDALPETIYSEGGVYRALPAPAASRHAGGALLASRRKRLGLLQREVAGALGIRVETVSAIETERTKCLDARDAYEALLDRLEGPQNLD